MLELVTVDRDQYTDQIREIFLEYLEWVNGSVKEAYGLEFDMQAKIEDDMLTLDKFMLPKGCLLLGLEVNRAAGVACLKELYGEVGEIKRMYVRPEFRRNGLGRALIEGLLKEASLLGYRQIRLDSARYMVEAHQLYRSMGFKEISAYEGSEIPIDFQKNWIFMEKDL